MPWPPVNETGTLITPTSADEKRYWIRDPLRGAWHAVHSASALSLPALHPQILACPAQTFYDVCAGFFERKGFRSVLPLCRPGSKGSKHLGRLTYCLSFCKLTQPACRPILTARTAVCPPAAFRWDCHLPAISCFAPRPLLTWFATGLAVSSWGYSRKMHGVSIQGSKGGGSPPWHRAQCHCWLACPGVGPGLQWASCLCPRGGQSWHYQVNVPDYFGGKGRWEIQTSGWPPAPLLSVRKWDHGLSLPAECRWSANGFWIQNAGVWVSAIFLTVWFWLSCLTFLCL